MAIQAAFLDMGGAIQTYWHTRELRPEVTPALPELLISPGINLDLWDEQLYEAIAARLARYQRWTANSLGNILAWQTWWDHILVRYAVEKQRMIAVAQDWLYCIAARYSRPRRRAELKPFRAELSLQAHPFNRAQSRILGREL